MKKRLLLVISIIVLVIVTSTMLFACSSSDKFEGSDYEKMEKFYAGAKEDVKKCEETLDALMNTVKASSFSAKFRLERTYYSTAGDNIAFKGDPIKGGYKENAKEDGTKWMVDAIDYTFDYNNGDYKITAVVYVPVASDDYNKKANGEVQETYTYMKVGETIVGLPDIDGAKTYCVDKMFDVVFGQFTNDEFLENYVTSAEKGFRFVTNMMQYQISRAFKYNDDGTINEGAVIGYEENKDKLLYTALDEVYNESSKTLSFAYKGEPKDIAGDDITYWAAYNEDITYNLYKTAAIYNDRVTMTYKNKAKQLQTYEYYGERVLPFYTQKSDFKTYKVLKAVVADYTHFIMSIEYKDVEIK